MIEIKEILEQNPIIPAIKDDISLEEIQKVEGELIFILTSNIMDIKETVKKLKENGKIVFVHVDLLDGLSNSTYAVDFLKENTELDGIISTKHHIIKYAKSTGLMAIQRFFLLDSLSLKSSFKYARENKPDAIELLPGLMPKIIKKLAKNLDIPIIAGGLVSDKEDIVNAIGAGAQSVSTTKKSLWNL